MKNAAFSSRTPARRLVASVALIGALFTLLLPSQGCLFSDSEVIDSGVVRTEQAKVYSSTALVALEVAQVKQGDVVDILRRESVTGPTYTEQWLQIRLRDDEETTGWIEARHVVSQQVVEESKKIAGSPTDTPAIAQGRLKVNQKLRLAPRRDGDVATILTRGQVFDIIGKQVTPYKPEATPKPKPGEGTNGEDTDEPEAEDEDEPETKNETWYRVRLDEGNIVRGGWMLGASVGLEVPDEILHLEGDGRRFVAWQVVGVLTDPQLAERDPENAERKNFMTFMRRGGSPEDVDYDRIYCIFWDLASHSYYTPYVDSELRGVFPIEVRQDGARKILTAHVLDQSNRPVPVELEIAPGDKGRLKVTRLTPPIPGERISRRR